MPVRRGTPEDHPYRNGARVIFGMRPPPNWKGGPKSSGGGPTGPGPEPTEAPATSPPPPPKPEAVRTFIDGLHLLRWAQRPQTRDEAVDYTNIEVLDRGWTRTLVSRFMPVADGRCPVNHYRNFLGQNVYLRDRVHRIERSAEFGRAFLATWKGRRTTRLGGLTPEAFLAGLQSSQGAETPEREVLNAPVAGRSGSKAEVQAASDPGLSATGQAEGPKRPDETTADDEARRRRLLDEVTEDMLAGILAQARAGFPIWPPEVHDERMAYLEGKFGPPPESYPVGPDGAVELVSYQPGQRDGGQDPRVRVVFETFPLTQEEIDSGRLPPLIHKREIGPED